MEITDQPGPELPALPPRDTERTDLPQTIYRGADERRTFTTEQLQKWHLAQVQSKHLDLVSDLPEADFAELPPLVDELYPLWDRLFGTLPPSLEGTPYRMTGYLMQDSSRFVDAKLLSPDGMRQHEGCFLGDQFWWNVQPSDYYTRHLLLHEATHCAMYVVCPEELPQWYVEGMPELLATHRLQQGHGEFAVFPGPDDELLGWGRIELIQGVIRQGPGLTLDQVLKLKFADFGKVEAYAWSWAVCAWLYHHPAYRDDFLKLCRTVRSGGFERESTETFSPRMPQMRLDWQWWAAQISAGHDFQRSAITWRTGTPLAKGEMMTTTVDAARGWQSSGLRVTAGQRYHIQASGRVQLNRQETPWDAEADGITIRYFDGIPLGCLQGIIAPEKPLTNASEWKFAPLRLGQDSEFIAPETGTLYLRVNDHWGELEDNSGSYTVEIR